jgi:cytochrome c oxidase subunit 2
MPIVVIAKEEAEYQAWLDERKALAAKLKELTEQTFSFAELMDRGEQVYKTACVACHQADGKGVPPTFPAIAGSAIAMGDISGHLDIVVFGSRKNPAMQAFGEQLSEVDLAAVLTYQRNAFGNNMGDSLQPIDILNYKESQ